MKLADQSWKEAWLRSRAKQERWEASIQRRAEQIARSTAWAEWRQQKVGLGPQKLVEQGAPLAQVAGQPRPTQAEGEPSGNPPPP